MTTLFKDQILYETLGETISVGDMLYKSTGTGNDSGRTAGRMYKLDTTNVDRQAFYGIAKESGVAADANKKVVTGGRMDGFTGLTAGKPVYASTSTPGAYTQTKPGSKIQVIGVAVDADTISVNSALAGSFGAGEGSGFGINYISGGDAESGTTGWATYADAAGTVPVDGIGGSPSVTLAVTTSSPLRGLQSFLFTKGASNLQGQGASYDFTIDSADKASIIRISMDYEVSANYVDTVSGNIISSDMQVFIYDVTNAQLIYCSQQNIAATSTKGKFVSSFQAASNSTSYRLIFHVASTNATSYTVKFDNVAVGPQSLEKGAIITDWQAYTPTVTGSSSNPSIGNGSIVGRYKRVGDSAEIEIELAWGSTSSFGSGQFQFSLPSGLSIDTNKVAFSSVLALPSSASLYQNSGGTVLLGEVVITNTNLLNVRVINGTTNHPQITNTVPWTWAASDKINFTAKVPILGWSSNMTMSEDTGNRLIVARAKLTTAQTAIASKVIPFNSIDVDTTNSFNSSTGVFTAPESGNYAVVAHALYGSLDGVTDVRLQLRKNTVLFNDTYMSRITGGSTTSATGTISDIVYLAKGDTLDVFASGDASFDIDSNGSRTTVSISKISSPQTLAGSETVAARYTTAAGQSITNGSAVIVNFDTMVYDTHGAVTTGASWKFTCPVSGKYSVKAHVRFASGAFGFNNGEDLYLFKNGSNADVMGSVVNQVAATYAVQVVGSTTIDLVKGDYIEVRAATSESTARSLLASALYNTVAIERIG